MKRKDCKDFGLSSFKDEVGNAGQSGSVEEEQFAFGQVMFEILLRCASDIE
jgi:hypothetical protein